MSAFAGKKKTLEFSLNLRESLVDSILDGTRKWVVRGKNSKNRGRIGLLTKVETKSKTERWILKGTVVLKDVVEVTMKDLKLKKNKKKHLLTADEITSLESKKKLFAFVFENPQPFPQLVGGERAVEWAQDLVVPADFVPDDDDDDDEDVTIFEETELLPRLLAMLSKLRVVCTMSSKAKAGWEKHRSLVYASYNRTQTRF